MIYNRNYRKSLTGGKRGFWISIWVLGHWIADPDITQVYRHSAKSFRRSLGYFISDNSLRLSKRHKPQIKQYLRKM